MICLSCEKLNKQANYQTNRQLRIAQAKSNYLANRDSRLEYLRQYRRENSARLAALDRAKHAANPEVKRKLAREWAKNNPEAHNAAGHVRRARLKAGGRYTVEEWCSLKEYYDYRCLCCGRPEPEIRLVPDHVIPISKGGPNTIGNIQPLCSMCNGKKFVRCTDY